MLIYVKNHEKKIKIIFFNICLFHANFMLIYVKITDRQTDRQTNTSKL